MIKNEDFQEYQNFLSFLSFKKEFEMSNYKDGDVVSLKSGGPPMTVEYFEGEFAHCVWFDGTKKITGSFRINNLEKEKDQEY